MFLDCGSCKNCGSNVNNTAHMNRSGLVLFLDYVVFALELMLFSLVILMYILLSVF